MPYLEVFGIKFEKVISYFKSPPWNLSNHKITKKKKDEAKMPKFWTKNTLFGYFGTRIFKSGDDIWDA